MNETRHYKISALADDALFRAESCKNLPAGLTEDLFIETIRHLASALSEASESLRILEERVSYLTAIAERE